MLDDSLDTTGLSEGVKGHVTVELFDAETGELVEKQEDDNFIANGGKEYFKYLQRVAFRNQVETLNPGSDIDYTEPDRFARLMLSNSTMTADETNEWKIPGVLVGYSDKTVYAGADTLLGSPNATLSESTTAYTKWVFDWPSHAANGTIGSVSWHASYGKGYSEPVAEPIFATTSWIRNNAVSFAASPIAYNSGGGFYVGSASTVTVYDDSLVIVTSFSTIAISGLVWDDANSKLWVISGTQIASYSSTGTVIDAPAAVTTRTYSGLAYDGTNLWTVAGSSVYEISTAGADVSTFAVDLSAGAINSGLASVVVQDIVHHKIDDTLYVMLKGYKTFASYPVRQSYNTSCRVYNKTGSVVEGPVDLYGYWRGGKGSYEEVSNMYIDYKDRNTFISSFYTGGWSAYPLGNRYVEMRFDGMGTRALLSSPIVKTSAQTLRITYQMDY